MNIKRGLFRTWLVASALWVTPFLFFTIAAFRNYSAAQAEFQKEHLLSAKPQGQQEFTYRNVKTGKKITLAGDSAPTDEEFAEVLKEMKLGPKEDYKRLYKDSDFDGFVSDAETKAQGKRDVARTHLG